MGLLSTIGNGLKALATFLGLIQQAKDQQAGANMQVVADDKEVIAAEGRMNDVQNKPDTGDTTVDKLQHGKF